MVGGWWVVGGGWCVCVVDGGWWVGGLCLLHGGWWVVGVGGGGGGWVVSIGIPSSCFLFVEFNLKYIYKCPETIKCYITPPPRNTTTTFEDAMRCDTVAPFGGYVFVCVRQSVFWLNFGVSHHFRKVALGIMLGECKLLTTCWSFPSRKKAWQLIHCLDVTVLL